MQDYKIVYEIVLSAESPLEAAELAQEWIKEDGVECQFFVQNVVTGEIHSVDLEEDTVKVVTDYKPLIS